MRFTLTMVCILAAAGCGGSKGGGGAGGGGNGGGGGVVNNDMGAGAGGGGSGGGGGSVDGGHSHDGGFNIDMIPTCDPVAQTGCAAGQKCVPGGFGWDGGTCVPAGSVMDGQACTQTATDMKTFGGTVTTDNCAAGTVCTDEGTTEGSPMCRKICTQDSQCGTGQACSDAGYNTAGMTGLGVCVPTCTPFASTSTCPTGYDCGGYDDDVSAESATSQNPNPYPGIFICKKTGAGAALSTCTTNDDCGANMRCGRVGTGKGASHVCLPLCDSTHQCPVDDDDGGTNLISCIPFTGAANTAGFCANF